MDYPTPIPRLRMTLLDERYYEEGIPHSAASSSTAGRPVVCRLWRMAAATRTPVYALGMESPTKRYLYCVGEDESAARRLLDRIAEGRLSPLHLGDVVDDFLWETRQERGEVHGAFPETPYEICEDPLQTGKSMV